MMRLNLGILTLAMLVNPLSSCFAPAIIDGKIDSETAREIIILGTDVRIPEFASNIYVHSDEKYRSTQLVRFDGPKDMVVQFAKNLSRGILIPNFNSGFHAMGLQIPWWPHANEDDNFGVIIRDEKISRRISVNIRRNTARIWIATMKLEANQD